MEFVEIDTVNFFSATLECYIKKVRIQVWEQFNKKIIQKEKKKKKKKNKKKKNKKKKKKKKILFFFYPSFISLG